MDSSFFFFGFLPGGNYPIIIRAAQKIVFQRTLIMEKIFFQYFFFLWNFILGTRWNIPIRIVIFRILLEIISISKMIKKQVFFFSMINLTRLYFIVNLIV